MTDKTTGRDLAEKIEWVGFSNLTGKEKAMVGEELTSVCRHLPRLLSKALWRYYGKEPPFGMETRSSEGNMENLVRRDQARQFIEMLMKS